MAHDSEQTAKWEPILKDWIVDGTGDEAVLRLTLDDGTMMRFTKQNAHALIGVFDDIDLDRIHYERNDAA